MDIAAIKRRIELRQGDITEMEVDAIVNSANTDLIMGAGVSGAISRKGGPVIQEECDKIGSVRVGHAVATSAGALRARHIIHAATMEIGHFTTERDVGMATLSALRLAEELGARSVAFPAIGTGAAALAPDYSARAMFGALLRHFSSTDSKIERVYLVLYNEDTYESFRNAFERLGQARRGRSRRRGGSASRGGRGG